MRILVTGAAGFIGSAVSTLLLKQGDVVVGVDNLNDAYDVRLKHWRIDQLKGRPGFDFHCLDISSCRALESLAESTGSFDGVINLAARAGVRASVEDPWIYLETNANGTLNLLELCRKHRIGKFVLASSSSLYGQDNPMPFREDANTDHPLSPYAASKKAAEALCYTYHHLYGIDVTVFRYFTVYGPAGRPDMSLFRFVQWIYEGRPVTVYGDGRQSRDFTFVDDAARGTVAGLRAVGYEVFNLGSDDPVALVDSIHLIEQMVGQPACIENKSPQPVDVKATWADISKAKKMLGWQPEQRLANGLAACVEWYRANRDWAKDIITV